MNKGRILQNLNSFKEFDPVFPMIWRIIKMYEFSATFNLKVSGSKIYSQYGSIDLEKKTRILQVFILFLENDQFELARDTLIEKIYLSANSAPVSLRQTECLQHNVVKLISRARRLAETNLNRGIPLNVDWFPYDPCRRTWKLFNIKGSFV